jgi:hypothetical protein
VSLINDALKRAQTQKSQTDLAPATHPLADLPDDQPATPRRASRRKNPRVIVLIAAVALVGAATAAWQFLGAGLTGGTPRKATAAAAVRPPASPAQAGTPTPSPKDEIQEILAKTRAAIKYYTPPVAGANVVCQDPYDQDNELFKSAAPSSAAPVVTTQESAPASGSPTADVNPPAPLASPAPTTQPAPAPVQFDVAKYKVGGVLLDDENSSAVVNGRIVRLGDIIDGAKVVKITSRNVQVRIAGQDFFLGT